MKIEYDQKNVSSRTNEGLFNAPYEEKENLFFLTLNGHKEILFKNCRNLLSQHLQEQYLEFNSIQEAAG